MTPPAMAQAEGTMRALAQVPTTVSVRPPSTVRGLLEMFLRAGQSDRGMYQAFGVALRRVGELEREAERKDRRIAQLEHHTRTDAATGLLNRRGFDEALDRALALADRHAESGALFIVDLDGFKAVNDRHGHLAGDAVLVAVATALLDDVRMGDDVARIGGDEFAVIMPGLAAGEIAARSRRLTAKLARICIDWEDTAVYLGASVGCATFTGRDDPAAVFTQADEAMYRHKSLRRNTAAKRSRQRA